MTGFFPNIFRSNIRVFFAIAALVLAAYSFMLASPFKTMDDDFSIVRNGDIHSLHNIPHFFRSTYFKADQDYYRPMVYVTYAIEYHFFGLNYFHYNLDNVLLHILNAWLVFLLAGILLRERVLAAAVALLFAIHPIHWEAVGNVSGRAILLCAFFVLSGIILFLKFFHEKKPWLLAGAIACYVMGLTSKESAGVLILTLAVYAGLIDRTRDARSIRSWTWILPFAGIAAGYLFLRHVMGIAKMFPWPSKSMMVLGQVSFLKGILIYLRLLVMPVGLHFDRGLPVFHTFRAPGFWLTLAAWSVIVGTVWKFRRHLTGLPLFCLIWFLIELLPVSQIMTTIGVYPGAISLAEHFLYVASVPAIIFAVVMVRKLMIAAEEHKVASARVLRGACAGAYLFFFIMLVQQNIYASNEFVMLRDSLVKDPQNSRLQYSMGMIYAKARNYGKAVEHFRNAVHIHACNYTYHIALGKALADNGELIASAREYEAIPPRKDVNWILDANKRAVYSLLVADYKKKVAVAPADPELHFALGVFYTKLEKNPLALAEYRRAAELKPDYYDALFNIATTSEGTGDRAAAREAYRRLAAAEDPKNPFRAQAKDGLARLEALSKNPTSP